MQSLDFYYVVDVAKFINMGLFSWVDSRIPVPVKLGRYGRRDWNRGRSCILEYPFNWDVTYAARWIERAGEGGAVRTTSWFGSIA